MKALKYIPIIVLLFLPLRLQAAEPLPTAQQRALKQSFQAKYADVAYHPQGGGWFLLTSDRDGVLTYSMADSEGQIVAADAIGYQLFDGFIRLRVADKAKKHLHDIWQQEMVRYDSAYHHYSAVKAEYAGQLQAYNIQVQAAKEKALEKYNKQVEEAQRAAQAEQKSKASSAGGILGGVLNVLGSAVATASATASVNYDAILRETLEAANLLVPPSQPYNPEPVKPQEPDSGYYWKAFTYRQPCPYDEVEYDAITQSDGYARVQRGGKYGLVNAQLQEIMPCEYQEIRSAYGFFLCKRDHRWGVFSSQAKELYPCQYQDVDLRQLGDNLCLFVQQKGLWGALDFHSGTEILPCHFNHAEPLGDQAEYIKTTADGRVGLYTARGILLFPCAYTDIRPVHLPDRSDAILFELATDHSLGLYDNEGVAIIPTSKYNSYRYEKPFLLVEQNGLWGVCSDLGEEIVPCQYSRITAAPRCFVVSSPEGLSGLVDYSGREIFPLLSATITDVFPQYIQVCDKSGKYGALNYQGKLIVPIKNHAENIAKKVDAYAHKNDLKAENASALENRDIAYNAFSYRHHQTIRQRNTFHFYAQNYVERIVNDWQKKGEFEKLAQWQKRVNGETRKQKVFMLTKDAQEAYVAKCSQRLPQDTLAIVGSYDPDNETYRIRTNYREEDILVPVPTTHALEFKTLFASMKKVPSFFVEGDTIGLAEYQFHMSDQLVFKFSNSASLTYNIAQVDYNFDHISIDPMAVTTASQGKQTISTSNIAIANSDVDIQIPTTARKEENTFVVIIANKHYDEAPNVDYAFNDGYIFKEYCIKTLGIPSANIRFKEDATFNNIREAVNWIRDIAHNRLYQDKARFIFYYSGHGVPDELTRSMYLLPKDGVAANITTTGYKISDLYDVLAETDAESLVLLDACFSGFTKSGSALTSTKGVVKLTSGAPRGNTVVLSAASSNELAHQYQEKAHGLFTYYLLKKLQESQGEISLGELFTYVEKQVVRTSLTVMRKSQTPSAAAGPDAQVWKERKL